MPRQHSPWLSEVWGAEGTLGHIPPATGDNPQGKQITGSILFPIALYGKSVREGGYGISLVAKYGTVL